MLNILMKCAIWTIFLIMHMVVIVLYIVLTVCFCWPVLFLSEVVYRIQWCVEELFNLYDEWSSNYVNSWGRKDENKYVE